MKAMLGTNATVTIGECGYVIRYRNDHGDMLSMHDSNKTVLHGDSVVVPFFAEISAPGGRMETGIVLTKDIAAVIVHMASVCFSEGLSADDYKAEARLMTNIASTWPDLKDGYSWLPWESWEEEAE